MPDLRFNAWARAFVPTGKAVKLLPERAAVIVRDGKLASRANVTPPDGGLVGVARQVGASISGH